MTWTTYLDDKGLHWFTLVSNFPLQNYNHDECYDVLSPAVQPYLLSVHTIDNIMNSDTSLLTGQKRTLPASIASLDMDCDCASVSELDCSF